MIIDLECPHSLPPQMALERTKELADAIQASFVPLELRSGGDVNFAFRGIFQGRARITERSVHIRMEVPLLLGWMQSHIKSRIREELDVYLYPLEKSPLPSIDNGVIWSATVTRGDCLASDDAPTRARSAHRSDLTVVVAATAHRKAREAGAEN